MAYDSTAAFLADLSVPVSAGLFAAILDGDGFSAALGAPAGVFADAAALAASTVRAAFAMRKCGIFETGISNPRKLFRKLLLKEDIHMLLKKSMNVT